MAKFRCKTKTFFLGRLFKPGEIYVGKEANPHFVEVKKNTAAAENPPPGPPNKKEVKKPPQDKAFAKAQREEALTMADLAEDDSQDTNILG